ncbi:MAG TPA: hypothetical protein DCY35_01465 [Prolixibacteraceae bacterium]|nr:hypothetical protein [Prolixibacteraceae bacterium]
MKRQILVMVLLMLAPLFHAYSQDKDQKVEAYYFHNKTRCMTCNTVEKVTKESLQELYGDKIVFKSLVFEDKSNKDVVKKYQVEGQSLIFVKGDKKTDITNYAFLNAVTRPEKLKEKIKETVDNL